MKRPLALLVLVAIVLGSGCTRAEHNATTRCRQADTVVVWTSDRDSYIQFYGDKQVLDSRKIPVSNLRFTRAAPRDSKGRLVMVSEGSPGVGEAKSVRIDPRNCNIAYKDAGTTPLAWAVSGDLLYTMGRLNDVGFIYVFDETGAKVNDGKLKSKYSPSSMEAWQGRLIVSADASNGLPGEILTIDPVTLKEVASKTLPTPSAFATDILIHQGKAYLATPLKTDSKPLAKVGVMDLAGGNIDLRELPETLASTIRGHGDDLLIAHTFMNPAFGELKDKKKLTVVPVGGGTPTVHTLKYGHWYSEVNGDSLLALGMEDNHHFHLTSYRIQDFNPDWDIPLQNPAKSEANAYFAAVAVPLRSRH